MGRSTPRSTDDRDLRWLRLRSRGVLPSQIAASERVKTAAVREVTTKIVAADLAESGEREGVVRRGYW